MNTEQIRASIAKRIELDSLHSEVETLQNVINLSPGAYIVKTETGDYVLTVNPASSPSVSFYKAEALD